MISNYIEKLSIINYKNIDEKEFIFDHKINCFVGKNGVGKTNILDSIFHLCIGKSYFKLRNDQIINKEKDFMMIEGSFLCNNKRENIVCSLKRGKLKILKRNKKTYKKLSNHLGLIPIVLISPYDTDLINDGSFERRKFIDSIISQRDKTYLNQLIDYNKIIQNRNKLLKNENNSMIIIKMIINVLIFQMKIIILIQNNHQLPKILIKYHIRQVIWIIINF